MIPLCLVYTNSFTRQLKTRQIVQSITVQVLLPGECRQRFVALIDSQQAECGDKNQGRKPRGDSGGPSPQLLGWGI